MLFWEFVLWEAEEQTGNLRVISFFILVVLTV